MKKLEVKKSKIEGLGICVSEDIKKGNHIAYITGSLVKKETKSKREALSIPLWFGVTKNLWLDPGNSIWRYFNHSCEPNTAIVGTKKLIAKHNIKNGEELTVDYSMTDGDLLWEMNCSCRTRTCRKKIHSIQRISENSFRRHLPFIPRYFVKLRKQYLSSVTI